MRKEALLTKQKLDKIRSEPERDRPLFDGIGKRSSLGKGRTGKILKEGHSSFTIRRICDSEKEEFQQIEKLRTFAQVENEQTHLYEASTVPQSSAGFVREEVATSSAEQQSSGDNEQLSITEIIQNTIKGTLTSYKSLWQRHQPQDTTFSKDVPGNVVRPIYTGEIMTSKYPHRGRNYLPTLRQYGMLHTTFVVLSGKCTIASFGQKLQTNARYLEFNLEQYPDLIFVTELCNDLPVGAKIGTDGPAIETRLQTTLPDDLPAALADGVVLCHLVNHVCKSTIPVIHVPSGGMPKLTMPKCLMNVDAFIEGCRKLGVNKV
eukprot:gene10709-11855_t